VVAMVAGVRDRDTRGIGELLLQLLDAACGGS
jgi:hypothetical protein